MYQINQLVLFLTNYNPYMRNFMSLLITHYNPRVNNITIKTKIQQHCIRIVANAFHETLM